MTAATCARCERTEDERPLTWSVEQDGDAMLTYCDACTRENVCSIEGRLDARWW